MRHYTENLKKIYKNIDCEHEFSLECLVYDLVEGDSPERTRPAMLVIPGGGYSFVSGREGTPIALSFLAKGFNCYVLDYSTTGKTQKDRFPVQLLQAAAAIDYIKSKAKEHHTDINKISVCGFSAGGHLAGMISTLFNHESVKKAFPKKPDDYFRPYATVLSYAVLCHEVGHAGSFKNVSGGDEETAKYLSLEKRVTEKTPPAFIWCTSDDGAVDSRNSLFYAAALWAHGIRYELHVYPKGSHGLSLANALTSNGRDYAENDYIAGWIDLAADFLLKRMPTLN